MDKAKRMNEYRKEKSKDEKWVEEDKNRRKTYYEKKKEEDPDFFNKKMKIWRDKKKKEDPTWGARRQKEFRKKYPEKFAYTMARYYFRKLTLERRKELVNEVENGQR